MKKICIMIGTVLLTASCGGGAGLPPVSSYTLAPAGNAIYVLSTQWGIVTRISMDNLAFRTYPVGYGATMILPSGSGVVVLNPAEDAVYIIGDTMIKKTVAVNLNDMVIAPDGTHAVVYHNYVQGEEANFTGILVFNTLSVVNLTTTADDTVSLSIGGGAPQQITFTPSGNRFIVISRNRCFVVPVSNPFDNKYIELWPDPSKVVVPDQVLITPQGDMALIRAEADNLVYVINLIVPVIDNVLDEDDPTQMAIFPDGNKGLIMDAGSQSMSVLTFDHTAVTLSEQSVALTTPSDRFATSFSCTGACSLSTATYAALAYSPTSSSTALTCLKIKNDIMTTTVYGGLAGPAISVVFAPDLPAKAVVTNGASLSSGLSPGYALSIIDTDQQTVNPVYLATTPSSFLFAKNQEGSDILFMTLGSSNELVYYDMESGASGDLNTLPMPGTIGGVVGNILFISHDQPLGLLTLIDVDTLQMRIVKDFNVYKLLDR